LDLLMKGCGVHVTSKDFDIWQFRQPATSSYGSPLDDD
jgi:hypothetical protein